MPSPPFVDVIETEGSAHFAINNGSTKQGYHCLVEVQTATPDDSAIISIFRAWTLEGASKNVGEAVGTIPMAGPQKQARSGVYGRRL